MLWSSLPTDKLLNSFLTNVHLCFFQFFGITQHLKNHLYIYIQIDLQYKFLEVGTAESKDTWILEVDVYCHVAYQNGCNKRPGKCLFHFTFANTGATEHLKQLLQSHR